jgi:multiple sugar transport system permease protein
MVSIARRLTRFPGAFLAPAVVVLASIVLFPTIYLIYLSTRHWVVTRPAQYFSGLDNYRLVLGSRTFWESAATTGVFVTASCLVTLVLGLALAVALNRRFRGRGVVRALVVLPLLIPPVVAGYTWRFLLNREIGMLGSWILPSLGLDAAMLANPDLAMVSIVIADAWSRTSFMFLILLAALQGIDASLYEAARIDGASSWQEFVFISLPLLVPAMIVAVIFRAIEAVNVFDLIYVMTQGGPGTATQTLSIYGWRVAFTSFDIGRGAAIAVVMVIFAIIATRLLSRRLLR